MAYSGAYQRREPAPPLPAEAGTSRPDHGPAPRPAERKLPGKIPFDLGTLFQKTEAAGMETDDLLMALVLFLMYRESGDIDLLILLGVMLLT